MPEEADIGLDVSRETIADLRHLVDALAKWNKRINLVSPSTIKDAWSRHILDSAQLYDLADEGWRHWADFGSGGGFPGLVIAILSKHLNPGAKITMVESDQRKSTFLRAITRELSLPAETISKRIEDLECLGADVVSARALAPLPKLLELLSKQTETAQCCLFPKGENWKTELDAASESWNYEAEPILSSQNPAGAILKLRNISRA